MKLIFVLIYFFSLSLFASADENPTLKKILELYKRKDYKEITKLANDYIQSKEEISQDDKVIKFYFHTESDLQKLDIVLDKIYKNTDRKSTRLNSSH